MAFETRIVVFDIDDGFWIAGPTRKTKLGRNGIARNEHHRRQNVMAERLARDGNPSPALFEQESGISHPPHSEFQKKNVYLLISTRASRTTALRRYYHTAFWHTTTTHKIDGSCGRVDFNLHCRSYYWLSPGLISFRIVSILSFSVQHRLSSLHLLIIRKSIRTRISDVVVQLGTIFQ